MIHDSKATTIWHKLLSSSACSSPWTTFTYVSITLSGGENSSGLFQSQVAELAGQALALWAELPLLHFVSGISLFFSVYAFTPTLNFLVLFFLIKLCIFYFFFYQAFYFSLLKGTTVITNNHTTEWIFWCLEISSANEISTKLFSLASGILIKTKAKISCIPCKSAQESSLTQFLMWFSSQNSWVGPLYPM